MRIRRCGGIAGARLLRDKGRHRIMDKLPDLEFRPKCSAGQVVARVVDEWVPGLRIRTCAVAPLMSQEHSDVAALLANR